MEKDTLVIYREGQLRMLDPRQAFDVKIGVNDTRERTLTFAGCECHADNTWIAVDDGGGSPISQSFIDSCGPLFVSIPAVKS